MMRVASACGCPTQHTVCSGIHRVSVREAVSSLLSISSGIWAEADDSLVPVVVLLNPPQSAQAPTGSNA